MPTNPPVPEPISEDDDFELEGGYEWNLESYAMALEAEIHARVNQQPVPPRPPRPAVPPRPTPRPVPSPPPGVDPLT